MKVLLGVTGGIAAYKAAELVRALQQRGVDVQVAMTASAEEFVRPLTFAALSGHPVLNSLWSDTGTSPQQPRTRSQTSPSSTSPSRSRSTRSSSPPPPPTPSPASPTASPTTCSPPLYLATTAPVLLAPAMNVNMWEHPATQANVRLLEDRGAHIVAPGSGYLACGMTGGGRLAEVETIADAVARRCSLPQPGPRRPDHPHHRRRHPRTHRRRPLPRQPLQRQDGPRPRRRSRLPAALTSCWSQHPRCPRPPALKIIRVATTAEMRAAVLAHLPQATMVIKAAAVADFRPAAAEPGKLRRGSRHDTHARTHRGHPRRGPRAIAAPARSSIGFAAEAEDVLANGRRKLLRKGVDALVVNDVSRAGTGFDSERNAGWWLTPDATVELPESSKRAMAERILTLAAGLSAAHPASPRK